MKLFIVLLLLCPAVAFSQHGKWTIAQIDSIVAGIDTMQNLKVSTVEGTINIKGQERPKGSFVNSYHTLTLPVNVMKVVHRQSLFYLDVDTYYFIDDNLVLVTTNRQQPTDMSSNAAIAGKFYFHDGKVTEQYDQKTPANPAFLMERAKSHLRHRDAMSNPLK